ncbi:MAG: type IV toxin-antitoxin system AbiEi family antitoxin [Gammaproteobacteria bacterium]|nr:type IV toxin-antitoxin system AbiEi family antitoxin [Gammaproteobacteria bacterium]
MNENNQIIEADLPGMATDVLYKETGLRLINVNESGVVDPHYDVKFRIDGYEYIRFTAKVKRWAQQTNFGVLVNEVNQRPGKGMLVADYVNPKMADKLRELDVPFIDTAGNAYINEKPLYIFIKGNKNRAQANVIKAQDAPAAGRAFQPTGIKVVYALIRHPQLVTATYRDIANITGVALGTVGWVINDLKQAGYLIEYAKKQRRLKNKKQLLHKWVAAYLEKLRPKLFLGAFTAESEYWWMDLDEDIVDYKARWGGEVAAAKMTGQVKPEKIIIYMHQEGGNKLLAENRLHKHPKGNIQIYRTFWKEKLENETLRMKDQIMGCVDPMIVYADLLATVDARNLATAKSIYDERLDEFAYE